MKNSLIAFVMGGLLLASATARSQTTAGRIVTVDLNRIFNEYYKTPIATAKLKDTVDMYKKEQEDMIADYRKQIDDLNKLKEDADKPEYTAEVKDQKRRAVQEKLAATQKTQNDITDYQRSHQQILQNQTDRMRQTILNEIKDVVSKESRDAGYMMVFDKSGNTLNGIPPLVYSLDSMDITDDIIKTLNKNQPKTSEVPKATETPKATDTSKPADKKPDKAK